MDTPSYYPDGLTEAVIDGLIGEAYREAGAGCRPSSALVDGSAAERRSRRCRFAAWFPVLMVRPRDG